MPVDLNALVSRPTLNTSCGTGLGMAVCPALGLLVTSKWSANTLSVFALPGAPSAPGGVFAPPAATTPLPPVPIFGMPLHGLYNSDNAAVRNTDGQVLETIPTV